MPLRLAVLSIEALTVAGIVYTLLAAVLVGRWRGGAPVAAADPPPVTLLKPLHGDEPALAANLGGFLDQAYSAPVEMICGVRDADDAALAAVATLGRPERVTVRIDAHRHGANAKISNLINLTAHARHDVLVLSDSDIAVGPDYLARVTGALAVPGTGAVTCLYAGRGDAGGWSRLAAAGIGWQFLPGVMVGLATGLAQPCMGSTIALTRETLDRIGGFARFADTLADDHAIGAAVRALGLRVAVPAMLVTHGCAEASLRALVRHELRWHATVRGVDPTGFAGSVVTHPLPLALIGCAVARGSRPALALLALALAARMLLAVRIDRLAGRRTAPLWLLPARDVLSFMLFAASFCVRSVDWRGERLRMAPGGRVASDSETVR